jgi:hypothetical protein
MLKTTLVISFASVSFALVSGCQTSGGSPQREGSKAATLDRAAPPAQQKFAKLGDEYYERYHQRLKDYEAIKGNEIKVNENTKQGWLGFSEVLG